MTDDVEPSSNDGTIDVSESSEQTIVSWLDDDYDSGFDVREFLNDRKPSVEGKRSSLYTEGLSLISSELGGSGVDQLNREIGEMGDIDRLLAGEIAASDVEEVLTKSSTAIQKIDEAQSTPKERPLSAVFIHDMRVDGLTPDVQATRQFARLTVIEAYHASANNKIDDAIKAVKRLLQLSRDLQPQGTEISQLVSISIDQIAIRIVSRFLLGHPNLNEAQCDKIIAAFDEHERKCLPRYLEALQADYVSAMNSVAAVQKGEMDSELLFGLISSMKNPPKELNAEVEFTALTQLTRKAIDESNTPFSRLADPTETESLLQQLIDESKAAAKGGNLDVSIVAVLLFPNTSAVRVAELRAIAGLRGTRSLLAIRRYEIENNEFPAELESAIAASALQHIPEDPFGDGPLKYALLNGEPTVYSIGVDGEDDGGKVDSNWGQQPGDILFALGAKTPK